MQIGILFNIREKYLPENFFQPGSFYRTLKYPKCLNLKLSVMKFLDHFNIQLFTFINKYLYQLFSYIK